MERLRAFNPCALIEFLVGPLESYFTRRLLDHAHSRNAGHDLFYDRLLSRMHKVNPDLIKQIDTHLYEVPSNKLDGDKKNGSIIFFALLSFQSLYCCLKCR